MIKPAATAFLALLFFGCFSETEKDYDFTEQYMLLPVTFNALNENHKPDPTWCFAIDSLELCMYTEGERIRIGYTNRSSSTFQILWTEARYIDETGQSHALEVFPPDLVVPQQIEPGAHRWIAFVPEGKRYFKENGGYFHVEWLVPWGEGSLSESDARKRVEQLFDSETPVKVELPLVLPDGRRSLVVAVMKLLKISNSEFWVRYGRAKYEASLRESPSSNP